MLSDTVNFIIKGWTVTGRNGEVTGLASGACGFVSLGPEQSCSGTVEDIFFLHNVFEGFRHG